MIMVQGAQIAWREVRAIVVGLAGLTLVGLSARRRWLANCSTSPGRHRVFPPC